MKLKPEIDVERKGKKISHTRVTCEIAIAVPVVIYIAYQVAEFVFRLFHK
jgi:hypothetical protein